MDTGASKTSISELPKGLKLKNEIIRISGVKGEDFEVRKTNETKIRGPWGKELSMELLYVPEPGINMLGRDVLSQMGITIRFREHSGVFVLTDEDVQDINPVVWVNEENGWIANNPPQNRIKRRV